MLNREVFHILLEVPVLTEQYRQTYNRVRPHSYLGYRPPAPETVLAADPAPIPVGITWRVAQPQGAGQFIPIAWLWKPYKAMNVVQSSI